MAAGAGKEERALVFGRSGQLRGCRRRQLQLPWCLLGSRSWGEGVVARVCGRRRGAAARLSVGLCSRLRLQPRPEYFRVLPRRRPPLYSFFFLKGGKVLTRRWAADHRW